MTATAAPSVGFGAAPPPLRGWDLQPFDAAVRLHQYLTAQHWTSQGLIGPDPGVRFNYRAGRFIKSYLRRLPWNDRYYYAQAQGYWVLGNWLLWARTGAKQYRDVAIDCSNQLLRRQRDDGSWEYPNPEWKGRIATAEGTWGSIGLLESYRQTADVQFLDGASRWYKFLVQSIGFQQKGEERAVNYFAGRKGGKVPNNSAFVLRFLAELADLTRDQTYLWPCGGMLTFLRRAQNTTGEFPYSCPEDAGSQHWSHFQCYQYNAFECLDLIRYYELTHDPVAPTLITRGMDFLSRGLAEDGHALYECGNPHRAVTYHSAVVAAALFKASQLGWDKYEHFALRAYSHLLSLQRADGGFPHSRGDYRLLKDQRSYPRYLAMILYHLLLFHHLK